MAGKIEETFRNQSIELLDSISSMISDANDHKLTQELPNTVDVLKKLLAKKQDIKSLIVAFIEKHEYWSRIKKREFDFLINDIPKMFSTAEMSFDILVVPFVVYKELTEGKHKKYKKNSDFPITSEDIDALWGYFDILVRIGYVYNRDNNLGYDLEDYKPVKK